jgi:1,2-dihydroxy-3-keto-5-methylthiopentene dioxygenase
VLYPDLPQLPELCAKFDKCHTHDDVEVRYIVDGEGSFGFVRPDGSQVELTMSAGEYINVPANSEHWFRLTSTRRIKAVRYFSGTDGWVPKYTGTALKFA